MIKKKLSLEPNRITRSKQPIGLYVITLAILLQQFRMQGNLWDFLQGFLVSFGIITLLISLLRKQDSNYSNN